MTLRTLPQALLICLLLQIGSAFFSTSVQAQGNQPVTTSEIGIGIGGANYKGEISPNYRFLNNQPALTVFYRRDMSNAITLRGGLLGSHRIFDDKSFSDEAFDERPLHAYRQAELKFSLLELSGVVEYNFLDYYDRSQSPRLSPYLFVGIAGMLYNKKLYMAGNVEREFDTDITVAIPVGVGLKYALSTHWNLGLEFGARKTFTDKLDHLQAPDFPENIANPHDNDWYFYNGISISYTFYRYNCPPIYKKRPGLLD
ncbi:Outer membrane protein beta-barrel domain-containing protein [Pontibacter chinhatensis]|uniref:Outer membrane protein beta-barrel domain-containing protein n=1 Tax=Pontibacter chinhatensis TaxID=1436961 RepID=A0A1I2YPP3_9BACT|nr:Outer membrane protein beta-barrel domain-containing protein [Pontibacter chinhatensis]